MSVSFAALSVAGRSWHSRHARNGTVALDRPAFYIGRMDSNDLVLTDSQASRHHAVIYTGATGYEVEDLGSSNGTYVQGQRITARVPLAVGQVIRIGSTELALHATPDVVSAGSATAYMSGYAGGGLGRAVAPQLGGAMPNAAAMNTLSPFAQTPPIPAHAAPNVAVLRSGPWGWLVAQLGKRYWRVFLLGMVAYLVAAHVLAANSILNMVPLVLLLASAVVPVTFVMFCWEQNAFADMPAAVVAATFMSGAVLGLTLAAIIEPLFLSPLSSGGIGVLAALVVSIIEETVKVVAIVWFLRDRRLRSELDGLILGAAAGMGFAALETAGYGFQAFLVGYTDAFTHGFASQAIGLGIATMNSELLARMALAVFGHGVWTAIVCAAIWRDRGNTLFRLTRGVGLAFGIAVLLHALWDGGPANLVWYILVGLLGLFVLRFFIRESLARAKVGPSAPSPLPLLEALTRYVLHPFAPVNVALASAALPSLCPRCGMPLDATSTFCRHCGAKAR